MRTAIYTFLIVALAAGLATVHALPLLSSNERKQEDAQHAKVVNFLNTDPELRKYYDFRFTGTFPSIPEELQKELKHSFPQYKFLLARMESTLHVTAVPLDLVIITDAESGSVVGYVWDFSWALPSVSFERLLLGQQAESKNEALNRINALAKLIVYTDQGCVRNLTMRNHAITAELLRNGSSAPFRILRIEVDNHFKFGRMTLMKTGRKV